MDNKVGYKSPPVGKRFQKGQSGNPRGRPKGSGNPRKGTNSFISRHKIKIAWESTLAVQWQQDRWVGVVSHLWGNGMRFEGKTKKQLMIEIRKVFNVV